MWSVQRADVKHMECDMDDAAVNTVPETTSVDGRQRPAVSHALSPSASRGKRPCSRSSPASPSRRRGTPKSTAAWAACWRPALSLAEGWAPVSTPPPSVPPQAGGRTGRENIYPSLRSRASSERRYPFDILRTGLGMRKAETCPERVEGLSASSMRSWPSPRWRSL